MTHIFYVYMKILSLVFKKLQQEDQPRRVMQTQDIVTIIFITIVVREIGESKITQAHEQEK